MHPTPEKLRVGWLLGLNTGFVDAYTYYYHHERFASMQTGNLIQGGIALAKQHYQIAFGFALPVVFFALGAGFGWLLQTYLPKRRFSWQQHNLLVQASGIALITLFAQTLSDAAFVASLSFFMALQANSFTKLRGMPYATVMSTGNIRSFGEHLMTGLMQRDWQKIRHSWAFLVVIFAFVIGAFVSTTLTQAVGSTSLLGGSVILITVFLILNQKNEI